MGDKKYIETRWLYTTSENFAKLREVSADPCVIPMGCNERIGKAAMALEAVRVAHIFKRIKEDEDLVRWHNEMWNTIPHHTP